MMFFKQSFFRVLMVSALLSGVFSVKAQEQTIGLRGGITSGMTYKNFFSDDMAFEVIASFKNKGGIATVLFEFHEPASYMFQDKFFYYYGFGFHLGYYKQEECSYIDIGGLDVKN